MKQKDFSLVAGMIFLLVAIIHLSRIILQWQANIGGVEIPMWASWLGVGLAGFLAYSGLMMGSKK